MNPTACPEYTVQLKKYDYNAPTAYKCMTKAEYDSYNAQVVQKTGTGEIIFLGCLLLIAGGMLVSIAWLLWRLVHDS